MPHETNRRDFLKGAAAAGVASAARPADATPAPRAAQDPPPLAPPDSQPPDLKVPEPVRRKVGYALVGLGKLMLEEVLPALRETRLSAPAALVSGHPDKARKVAEAYGIPPDAIYSYEDYDKIANDARVDAVYIALPNTMHAEYTVRAFRARKHVLCEKPMSVTVPEAERMLAASKEAGRLLAIAYRLHYEPLNRKVMELCAQKAYGEVKLFSASNNQNVQSPNIRLSAKLGGGPVGDVGVYCINAARYVLNEEPVEVVAYARQPRNDPRFREVPESVSFTLRYPSGAIASCECSFGTERSDRYRVTCADGYIDMDPAFSYRGLRLRVKQGGAEGREGRDAEVLLRQVDHFAAEFDAFSECVLENKPSRTPGEMGLADMRIVVAVAEAWRTGRPVRVGRAGG